MKVLSAPIRITRPKSTAPKTKTSTGLQSPFPRLQDPSKKQELAKQFEPYFRTFFAAPQLSGYLASAVTAFFNDKRVYRYSQSNSISGMLAKPDKAFTAQASGFAVEAVGAGSFDSKMRITDNNVVLYTNPLDLNFVMTIPGPQNQNERASLQ